MRSSETQSQHVAIFIASLVCICLELFLTRILNLKAWNHVVYTVIPFAMLGYGIGANIVLISGGFFQKFKTKDVLAVLLVFIGATSLACALLLKDLPIEINYILTMFDSFNSVSMLLLAYTLFMVPFILIGFLIVYLFTVNPRQTHILYFSDLLGAALGAYAFFVLINQTDVFHSLALLSLLCFLTAVWICAPKIQWLRMAAYVLAFFAWFYLWPEPVKYAVDPQKGWEWIPGYCEKEEYDYLASTWHALGRSDVFRIKNGSEARQLMFETNPGTFEINLDPRPEFSYFSSNFLAGTPVYEMSEQGIARKNSQIKLFSQRMEVAYTLLDKPRVLIIGAGGGRDIFMAQTHGATDITGAEINPGIVAAMSPGGRMYDYSGRIYTRQNTRISCIDGRHLVKQSPSNSRDLIILNGVDTFSGLSTGAYAYAESYLYTESAIEDYLRVLTDNGILNMFRWSFLDMPREELRLYAIALSALKKSGAKNPWDHIIVGVGNWSVFLIKKTPFTDEQRKTVADYFKKHAVTPVQPPSEELLKSQNPMRNFVVYTEAFKNNAHKYIEKKYPYDISVVTDDNPFFYKYYKLDLLNLFNPQVAHHTGTIVFMTQAIILIQAIVFIALFIFLPLVVFKKDSIRSLRSRASFIVFFACLGLGFMFIEISSMQRFVLLLGSPIYAISVVLAALLAATGIGSLVMVPWLEKRKDLTTSMAGITCALIIYIVVLMLAGTRIFDFFMGFPFVARIMLVTLIILPMGLLLGTYFPVGMRVVGRANSDIVAWSWGLNCGFSVLGSVLSIIIAQFSGFNAVLGLALLLYAIAYFALKQLNK